MADVTEEHDDSVKENETKKKIPQSHSHRKSHDPMKCLLCGCPRKKWHKCLISNGFSSKDNRHDHSSRSGFRGRVDASIKKRAHQGHNEDYNKNYLRRNNNKNNCNDQLTDEMRSSYRQDFYKEYYYYRFVRCCSDGIFGVDLGIRGIPGKGKLSTDDKKRKDSKDSKKIDGKNERKGLRSKDSKKTNEESRGVNAEINNNYKNKRQRDKVLKKKMDDESNKENFIKNRVAEKKQKKFFDKRSSPETEMKKKEAAKDSFRNGNFTLALSQYSELIKLFPKNEIYYGNRSACHIMMGNYGKALIDAKKSININPQFIEGHHRVIKCALTIGKIQEVDTCLLELEKINATDDVLILTRKTLKDLNEYLRLEQEAIDGRDKIIALKYINKAIEICPFCVAYKLRKARHLAFSHRYEEADVIASHILENDKHNSYAKYILSLHMYQKNLDKAIPYLENIIRRAPKMLQAQTLYQKARQLKELKEKGNQAFRAEEYNKAKNFYIRAMQIDPWNKKIKKQLHNNTAQVWYKLRLLSLAIQECTKALEIDENYLKALRTRGKCFMARKDFSAAIDDFQKCCEIDKEVEYKDLLDEAKKKHEEKETAERERRKRIEEEMRKKEEEERRRREEEQRKREEQRKKWEEEFRRRQEEEQRKREEQRKFEEEFYRNWRERQENSRSRSGFGGNDYFRQEEEKRKQREEQKERSSGEGTRSGNFHGVLGVDKKASIAEIKAAYRKLAMVHHPDRHSNASEQVRKQNELQMKLITQAYREIIEAKEKGFEFY